MTTTTRTDEVKRPLVSAAAARQRMMDATQRQDGAPPQPQGLVSASAARERMIADMIREGQR